MHSLIAASVRYSRKCAWYRYCEHKEDLCDSISGLVQALPFADKGRMPNVADLFNLKSVNSSFKQEVCEHMSGGLVC